VAVFTDSRSSDIDDRLGTVVLNIRAISKVFYGLSATAMHWTAAELRSFFADLSVVDWWER
jgi:hypothetical protein